MESAEAKLYQQKLSRTLLKGKQPLNVEMITEIDKKTRGLLFKLKNDKLLTKN